MIRPLMRTRWAATLLAMTFLWWLPHPSHAQQQAGSFDTLRRELWPLAETQGISRATFDLAFRGITPDSRVAALTKRQPEYGKPFGEYVASMATPSRIENGKVSIKNGSQISTDSGSWRLLFQGPDRRFPLSR